MLKMKNKKNFHIQYHGNDETTLVAPFDDKGYIGQCQCEERLSVALFINLGFEEAFSWN